MPKRYQPSQRKRSDLKQLKNELQSLLNIVSSLTDRHFDITKMFVGTVHSLCQRILTDRRFREDRQRGKVPRLMDELSQYFFLYQRNVWESLLAVGFPELDFLEANGKINSLLGDRRSKKMTSRHVAVSNTISLFNRFGTENSKEW